MIVVIEVSAKQPEQKSKVLACLLICECWLIKFSHLLLFLGALLMGAMMLHISLDVLSNNLLGRPLVGTNEMVTHYYMAACVFFTAAFY